jgi:hypothetical protein
MYYAAKYQNLTKVPCAPYFGSGILLIMLLRGNGYWLVPNLCQCKSFVDLDKNVCPFCGERHAETSVHLLLYCRRWNGERGKYLNGLIDECRNIVLRIRGVAGRINLSLEEEKLVVVLLLGGCVNEERLLNWLPSKAGHDLAYNNAGIKASYYNATFNDVGAVEGEQPFWASCGLYRVAGFMKMVDSKRSQYFGELTRHEDFIPRVLHNRQGAPA